MAINESPYHLGMASKTLEGHDAATNYINQFLREHNFLELDQMKEEHVEGDNFSTCLRTFSFGYPAHALGLIITIGLETHPKKNSSRELNNYSRDDSQHTKYLPSASTTGLQI